MKPAQLFLTASLAVASCTLNDEVHPTDMSAAAHDLAAQRDDALAAHQASKYDPDTETTRQRCTLGGRGTEILNEPCWSDSTNPTQSHLREAAWYRTVAKQHREAAEVLRDAEVRSCAGVSDQDKAVSPLAHREDILSTVVTTEGPRVTGVSILVRGVPGMSWDYLARMVDCHLARNAAMGFPLDGLSFDPLNVKGAVVKVEKFAGDFRLTITAEDEAIARKIAARATALMTFPGVGR